MHSTEWCVDPLINGRHLPVPPPPVWFLPQSRHPFKVEIVGSNLVGGIPASVGEGARPRRRSDVVDLDPIATLGAVEEQELRVLGHRAPRVDHRLVQALAAMRALHAKVEPLVAGDVLAAHQRPRRGSAPGGSQPGLGAGAASPSAAASASRVASVLSSRASIG